MTMRAGYTFESAHDAFRAVLKELVEHGTTTDPITEPTSVGSQFGHSPRVTTELIAAGFTIVNPRARVITSPARELNEAFAIANVLWTLSGSNDVEDISPYNQRGKVFAVNGLLKGAVGSRIRRSSAGDQLRLVVELLRSHPSSRRAVVHVLSHTDLADPPLDTPCTVSLQYVVRANQLEAITVMRSQSAALLLPYDVYLYTMLQELIASDLGIGVGPYHHFAGSLHFYEDESQLVRRILDETNEVAARAMPVMPLSSLENVDRIVALERSLRQRWSEGTGTYADAIAADTPTYWRTLLTQLGDYLAQHR